MSLSSIFCSQINFTHSFYRDWQEGPTFLTLSPTSLSTVPLHAHIPRRSRDGRPCSLRRRARSSRLRRRPPRGRRREHYSGHEPGGPPEQQACGGGGVEVAVCPSGGAELPARRRSWRREQGRPSKLRTIRFSTHTSTINFLMHPIDFLNAQIELPNIQMELSSFKCQN
jgi:hypothetical protein